MGKTKVLQIIGALNMGGAETMVVNIFRNIDRTRFQFDFFLSGNSGGFYEKEVLKLGARIFNVGRRKKNPVKYCVELFKLIRKEKYDVVQIHATDAQDGLPAMVAHFAGAKKICLFSHNTAGQSMKRQQIMRRLFMRYVTEPQACSRLAAEWMFGSKASEAMIIPLPIKSDICAYDEHFRETVRKKYGLSDKIVVGHIGRYQKPKNHSKLINIFSELVKISDEYRLMLIGTGNLKPAIDKQIEELGLSDKVIQLGQISDACKEISVFDVLVLPSLYEGFPTVLLEGQANGIHCVVSSAITKDIALTDLVRFVDLDESDMYWAKEIAKQAHLRENADLYNECIAKNYNVASVSKQFEKIYSN